MARRASRTPLYEIIKTRGQEKVPDEAEQGPRGGAESPESRNLLSPGRTVRVPIGYLFVVIACITVVIIGAYLLGYQRAENAVRAEYDDALFSMGGERPTDPLARPGEDFDGRGGESGRRGRPEIPGGATASSDWGPLVSDPRQAGLCYFILIETTDRGAREVGQYCRGRGLEAHVVSANNPTRRRVIVLPGFDCEDRSAREVKDLEERILQAGSRWRHVEGGATDFGDAYPSLYGG